MTNNFLSVNNFIHARWVIAINVNILIKIFIGEPNYKFYNIMKNDIELNDVGSHPDHIQ